MGLVLPRVAATSLGVKQMGPFNGRSALRKKDWERRGARLGGAGFTVGR